MNGRVLGGMAIHVQGMQWRDSRISPRVPSRIQTGENSCLAGKGMGWGCVVWRNAGVLAIGKASVGWLCVGGGCGQGVIAL
jgi:hypothetical protein